MQTCFRIHCQSKKYILLNLSYPEPRLCNSCQFHQHFKSSFCAGDSCAKKLQSRTVARDKKATKTLSYEKFARKMLMKLTKVDTALAFNSNYKIILIKNIEKVFFSYCLRSVVSNRNSSLATFGLVGCINSHISIILPSFCQKSIK